MNQNNTRVLYEAYNIYYENGIEAISKNNYETAARNLYNASETLLKLAKESEGALKTTRIKRADELYQMAESIKKRSNSLTNANSANKDLEKFGAKETKQKGDKTIEEGLTSFAPVSDTGVSFDEVAGLKEAKQEIALKVIEPNKHPEVFKRFNKKNGGGIRLYGVPGTGKTMLAQAIAHEIDAKFFTVKCSDILSKWVGDAEQNIRNLFEEARKYPTSIIFFDEFEAIAPKRDTY